MRPPRLEKPLAAARNLQPRMAALGGALALGLAAIFFARAGEAAQALFARLVSAYPLAPIVLTPAIFVGVTWLTRRHWPAARGSGIPQVMAAAEAPAHGALAVDAHGRGQGCRHAHHVAERGIGGP
jgi:H+/Cl- antiporter ClcA